MLVGFSFSPGGLLLPYHLGVLASLAYHGHITDQTPLAGSSAGAIAVASHACGVAPEIALDASIRISEQSDPFFVAQGHLMPSLHRELSSLLTPDAHVRLNSREGMVGLAYRELFPEFRPVLQTHFESRQSLINAICDSSMFPYFTSNRPFRYYHPKETTSNSGKMMKQRQLPRATVDGFFAVPLHRFGCPDFRHSQERDGVRKKGKNRVDRTVRVLALPHELVDINLIKSKKNIISPKLEHLNMVGQVTRLGLMATTKSRSKELRKLYESGWEDAAEWASLEHGRQIQ